MSTPLPRIAARIPRESQSILERLLSDPLRAPEELSGELAAYVGSVQRFARLHGGIDPNIVVHLARRCDQLIEHARGRPESDRRLVQAACLYLVAIEGDLDAGGGFDDDEAVIRAVELAIGAAPRG